MSAVTLLCADHPLPLYESGSRWTETSSHGGYTVSLERTGFAVPGSNGSAVSGSLLHSGYFYGILPAVLPIFH